MLSGAERSRNIFDNPRQARDDKCGNVMLSGALAYQQIGYVEQ